MSNVIKNPHDHFFRRIMRDLRVVKDFIYQYLPTEITEQLNFATLRRADGVHFQNNQQERTRDLTYEIEGHDPDIKVVCIIEHQSDNKRLMAYRHMQYLFMVLEDFFETHRSKTHLKFPMVFNFHFSNAIKSSKKSLDMKDLIAAPKDWVERYFFKTIKIDLNKIDNETLAKQPWIGLASLAMKRNKIEDVLSWHKEHQVLIDKLAAREATEGLLHQILCYNNSIRDVKDFKELKEYYESLYSAGENRPMNSFFEYLKDEGRAEGEAKGEARGVAKGEANVAKTRQEIASHLYRAGLDSKLISEATGIRVEELSGKLQMA